MHPTSAFRDDDRAFQKALIERIGFGMIFASTPDGPRVAHTPIVMTGGRTAQFHLARSNALTRHLTDGPALIVVNGPDAYISARWYAQADQVPTWNYVAMELEGRCVRLDDAGLRQLLRAIGDRHEGRIETGEPWTMDTMSQQHLDALLKGIVGFEMRITEWRETVKLSQNKSDDERRRVIDGLRANGSPAMAALMEGDEH